MYNDWTLDDGRVIRLLTKKELLALPDGTHVIDIFGKYEIKRSTIDTDTRGGYTAFGFLVKISMNASHFFAILIGLNAGIFLICAVYGLVFGTLLASFNIVFASYWTSYYANRNGKED